MDDLRSSSDNHLRLWNGDLKRSNARLGDVRHLTLPDGSTFCESCLWIVNHPRRIRFAETGETLRPHRVVGAGTVAFFIFNVFLTGNLFDGCRSLINIGDICDGRIIWLKQILKELLCCRREHIIILKINKIFDLRLNNLSLWCLTKNDFFQFLFLLIHLWASREIEASNSRTEGNPRIWGVQVDLVVNRRRYIWFVRTDVSFTVKFDVFKNCLSKAVAAGMTTFRRATLRPVDGFVVVAVRSLDRSLWSWKENRKS